jgi:predicted alpha/beta hydrolase family esterase
MIFHAKDDPYIPWRSVDRFAKRTGSKIKMLARGGHLKTEYIVQNYWPQVKQFFES